MGGWCLSDPQISKYPVLTEVVSKRNSRNQFVPGTMITENGFKIFKRTIFCTKFSKLFTALMRLNIISSFFVTLKGTSRKFSKNNLSIFSFGAYVWDAVSGCHEPVTGVQNQLVHSGSVISGVGVEKLKYS